MPQPTMLTVHQQLYFSNVDRDPEQNARHHLLGELMQIQQQWHPASLLTAHAFTWTLHAAVYLELLTPRRPGVLVHGSFWAQQNGKIFFQPAPVPPAMQAREDWQLQCPLLILTHTAPLRTSALTATDDQG